MARPVGSGKGVKASTTKETQTTVKPPTKTAPKAATKKVTKAAAQKAVPKTGQFTPILRDAPCSTTNCSQPRSVVDRARFSLTTNLQ